MTSDPRFPGPADPPAHAAPPVPSAQSGGGSASTPAPGDGAAAPDDPEGLLEGYAGTDYHVAGLPAPLRPGERHAGVDSFLQEQGAASLAILTAYNPRSETLGLAENARRQGELRARIEAAGLRCVEAEGRARDGSARPVEPLLAVFDAPPPLLLQWMEAFGQNAVVRVRAAQGVPRLMLLPAFRQALAGDDVKS